MIFFKDKINFYIFIVFSVLLLGTVFVLGDIVLALSANYSKINNEALSVAEWNELANDFLANSGGIDGVMSGDLDLNNNRVTTLGSYLGSSDAVNQGYVDSLSASASGGAIFVNWGRKDCPAGTNELYNGIAFGTSRADAGGSSNSLCIQIGSSGGFYNSLSVDQLYPLVTTSYTAHLPAEIPNTNFLKCAVCYNSGSSCYTKAGDNSCDGSYSEVYQGYYLGALATFASYRTSRKRVCVNSNFDSSPIAGSSPGAVSSWLHGVRIEDNFGLSNFTAHKFLRCAVCCN